MARASKYSERKHGATSAIPDDYVPAAKRLRSRYGAVVVVDGYATVHRFARARYIRSQ
jgi:hypothetical protein